ncbi:MAG: class I SAM-dependent methyltransferase [Pirellulales bacterium]
MISPRKQRESDSPPAETHTRKPRLQRMVESGLMRRMSFRDYQSKVLDLYDGPRGAFLVAFSTVSGHLALGERLLKSRRFDLRGVRRMLDVGCGVGQLAKHALRYGDPELSITCIDLSTRMLRRARRRLKNDATDHVAADLSRLPFADGSFDCVTCGYVLEHLPDAQIGLSEMARVLSPGGRVLLLTTEDNFSGACTSRFWRCRTYNRGELRRTAQDLGLVWRQDLWLSRMHQALKAGGICVELQKQG